MLGPPLRVSVEPLLARDGSTVTLALRITGIGSENYTLPQEAGRPQKLQFTILNARDDTISAHSFGFT